MTLLLASKSETRAAMLRAAQVRFLLVEAPLDEEKAKRKLASLKATDLAAELARLKASAANVAPEDLVLGSDQVLELETGEMLSKPRSPEDARDHLRQMAGRTHRLHSAASLVQAGRETWSATETVTLRMRSLSEDFIKSYLDEEYDKIRWSVGCYRIEELGIQLFEEIEGSHFAILGMPLLPLLSELRRQGILQS